MWGKQIDNTVYSKFGCGCAGDKGNESGGSLNNIYLTGYSLFSLHKLFTKHINITPILTKNCKNVYMARGQSL